MDFPFKNLPDSSSFFKFDDETSIPTYEQTPNAGYGLELEESNLNLDFMDKYAFPSAPSPDHGVFVPSTTGSLELDLPDDHDSDPVLKFLNQILLEENMEEKPSMFHDPLALQDAEKSLYDVIGEKYPPFPYHQSPTYIDLTANSPDGFSGNTSENSRSSITNGSNSVDSHWIVDPGDTIFPMRQQDLLNGSPLANSQPLANSSNSFSSNTNGQVATFVDTNLIPSIFSDSESILQFQRGMEEAMKFLPTNNQVIIDLDKYELPPKSDENSPISVVKVEKDERDHSPTYARGRKHLHRQDSVLEEQRSSKQSAVYKEEVELSEMFDKVLLSTDIKCEPTSSQGEVELLGGIDINLRHNGLNHVSNSGKARTKKQGAKSDVVDLRTLLVSCAQAVASDDRRTANEQLKRIRKHASSTGDACQRLANIFANGIEARLAGTGTQIYAALASKWLTAAEKLKAYQVYISACPFKKIAIFFANKMIMETAANASTLHIVDFGISYGFQWPILIQHLSLRPGGPPKLRITGIEFPQAGFRPAELIEETGRRLAKYCERFKVPFEYQAIATRNWEAVKIEDLKLVRDEVLAVNCLFRFKNLLDETVVAESPKDGVLNLIRKMKPDIFVHSTINASLSAPFFVTRFREALFYYSALFDMLDVTLPRENLQRFHFEKEFYGREVMSVIACEGEERVERPETYKQWQIRHMRAGFKLLPLNQELVKKLKGKVEAGYQKDFVFDEDGNWMLQGWKGRILYGSSCWVPA